MARVSSRSPTGASSRGTPRGTPRSARCVGSDGVLVVDTRATAPHGAEIRDHVRADRARRARPVGGQHPRALRPRPRQLASSPTPDPRPGQRRRADGRRGRADPRADPGRPRRPTPTTRRSPARCSQGVLDARRSGCRTRPSTRSRRSTSAAATSSSSIPGRGHTNGDLVVRVPDADVVYAGDLVEESAPPAYGSDCFPLDWAGTLDLIVGMLTPTSVVVSRTRRGGRPGLRDGPARGGLRRRRD